MIPFHQLQTPVPRPPHGGAAAAAASAAAAAAAGAGFAPSCMPFPHEGSPFGGVPAQPWALQPGDQATPVEPNKKSFKTTKDVCGICLELQEEVYQFGCRHFPFCKPCMAGIAKQNHGSLKCPICKAQVASLDRIFRLEKIP